MAWSAPLWLSSVRLEGKAPFPVTAYDAMEAGLTVMAIDRAMDEGAMIDCAPMWAEFDQARAGAPVGA